jgi:hypothetical protein
VKQWHAPVNWHPTYKHTHLKWSHGSGPFQQRAHLAGGKVSSTATTGTREVGQEVGHAKVRHQDVQWVQGSNEEVGGPQVPV